MEKIKPTKELKTEEEFYKLEDKDFLLIQAIRELTNAIIKLRIRR